MKVTVNHRERRFPRHSFYIDIHVDFSEEEKAIIKAGNLLHYRLSVGRSYRMPGEASDILSEFLRASPIPFAVIGFALMIVAAVSANNTLGNIGGILFLGAPIAWVAGWLLERRGNKAAIGRRIPVKHLMGTEIITVFAQDAAAAQRAEENVHSQLASLKEKMAAVADAESSKIIEI